jgi:flagellar protein FlaE
MFEDIARMFESDDSDPDDEPDDQTEMEDPDDVGGMSLDGQPQQPAQGGLDVDIDGLDARMDELEEDIDSTESSLRAVRSSQEEINDSISEMQDTVRRLAGVYDQLTAADNPFADDPRADGNGNTDGFAPADEDAGAAAMERFAGENDANGNGESTDDIVSFEDLDDEPTDDHAATAPDSNADPLASENPQAADPTPHSDPAGDGAADPEPTTASVEDHDAVSTAAAATEAGPDTAGDRPVLASVPDTYAGDVLMMEWLAGLMEQSGPAGALRAIEHYEDIGWLSPTVTEHLVDILGGPSLDVFVDPMQPHEPTADEHAASYKYIRAIDRLSEV